MIDPKELRLGNYVNLKIQDKLFVREVIGFSYKGIEVGMENLLGEIPDIGIKEEFPVKRKLLPIVITEELLVKFGFIDKGLLRFDKGIYSVVFMSDGVIYFQIDGENIKAIKYVHQLQNLYFALTGEELYLKPLDNTLPK